VTLQHAEHAVLRKRRFCAVGVGHLDLLDLGNLSGDVAAHTQAYKCKTFTYAHWHSYAHIHTQVHT
jgi:hypothetical protein